MSAPHYTWPAQDVASHVLAAMLDETSGPRWHCCVCFGGPDVGTITAALTVRCNHCGRVMIASTLGHLVMARWTPEGDGPV